MLRIEDLDPRALGQRLSEARKARGVTQEDAAKHIGCSRPTFIAVEKGNRLPKAEEIVKLASLYGRKVSDIVRPGEPVGEGEPREPVGTADGQAEIDPAAVADLGPRLPLVVYPQPPPLRRRARVVEGEVHGQHEQGVVDAVVEAQPAL